VDDFFNKMDYENVQIDKQNCIYNTLHYIIGIYLIFITSTSGIGGGNRQIFHAHFGPAHGHHRVMNRVEQK
jgi:hypothetical protein